MYTQEEKQKAVELFIKYDLSLSAVIYGIGISFKEHAVSMAQRVS